MYDIQKIKKKENISTGFILYTRCYYFFHVYRCNTFIILVRTYLYGIAWNNKKKGGFWHCMLSLLYRLEGAYNWRGIFNELNSIYSLEKKNQFNELNLWWGIAETRQIKFVHNFGEGEKGRLLVFGKQEYRTQTLCIVNRGTVKIWPR